MDLAEIREHSRMNKVSHSERLGLKLKLLEDVIPDLADIISVEIRESVLLHRIHDCCQSLSPDAVPPDIPLAAKMVLNMLVDKFWSRHRLLHLYELSVYVTVQTLTRQHHLANTSSMSH